MSQQVLSEVVGLRLLWICPCFISWISTIHSTIYGFSKTNISILRSFDFNSVLTRQTSEKVTLKSGFDNLIEHFLSNTFPESSAFCPKNFKISVTGGLQPPSLPRLVRLWMKVNFSMSVLHCISHFNNRLDLNKQQPLNLITLFVSL